LHQAVALVFDSISVFGAVSCVEKGQGELSPARRRKNPMLPNFHDSAMSNVFCNPFGALRTARPAFSPAIRRFCFLHSPITFRASRSHFFCELTFGE
jgi:hypothetical protein